MQNVSACDFLSAKQPSGFFKDYLGSWLVLYFYPKDSTPGCTQEGRDFRDNHAQFASLNTTIFGISRDSIKSHQNFLQKEQLNFDLISDSEEHLCNFFQVIKEKNMYGKKIMGIDRTTFIINPKGEIAHEWRNVKVPGHVLAVLQQLQLLQREFQ